MIPAAPIGVEAQGTSIREALSHRPFLLLWLAQAATQIGGNMVLYGLTVIIFTANRSTSAVSALILTFLVPAVLFSALAGVYVDRFDRRLVLVVTNISRGIACFLIFLVGDHLGAILLLTAIVSTITVFFAPAEAAMIPHLLPRRLLLAANGIFTLTMNACFALGFALGGPVVVTVLGPPALVLLVAGCYFLGAAFCWTLPPSPPTDSGGVRPREAVAEAEKAVGSTIAQLQEGLRYIGEHRNISWSLTYLGIAASLIGVLGVLGPGFAQTTLGLATKDFVVVVLPLGAGVVMGILLLNNYGHLVARRRVIEVGLITLGVLLGVLSVAGPVSRFLQQADRTSDLLDLSALTSLLAVVVVIAFFAGMSYSAVAIPSQTQLQEELPEDVRGRVFGVLNMLLSVASFLPIIVVGPIADLVGTTAVLFVLAVAITGCGIASVVRRGPLQPLETRSTAEAMVHGMVVDHMVVAQYQPARAYERTHPGYPAGDPEGAEDAEGSLDPEGALDVEAATDRAQSAQSAEAADRRSGQRERRKVGDDG